MAAITAHPQETVLKPPALEVVLKLLLDIPRQFTALLRQMASPWTSSNPSSSC